MEALVVALKELLSSQPVLQAFAGGIALIVVAWMVIRGNKDKEAAPQAPVAPGHVADPPSIFAQGPQEVWNGVREVREFIRDLRDLARRRSHMVEESLDTLRELRDLAKRQAELLQSIDKEQAVANRSRSRHNREDRE